MRIEPNTTLKCVADFIGAKKMIGSPDFIISGLNEIHEVEPGDITFVDHPKYYSKALNSAATTIIINTDQVDCPDGKALLFQDLLHFHLNDKHPYDIVAFLQMYIP